MKDDIEYIGFKRKQRYDVTIFSEPLSVENYIRPT